MWWRTKNRLKSEGGGRSFVRGGSAGRDDRCVSKREVGGEEDLVVAMDIVGGLGGHCSVTLYWEA